ncbi:MAG: fumarylacetoacetate hydrolase family protein [Acidimicrobiales bacterium]
MSELEQTDVAQAAELLYAAHSSGTPCPPVKDLLESGGVEAAYQAQELNTERWLAQGRRLVGRKIGLTSAAVQKQLGVDQPDYGMLFADMSVDEAAEIAIGRLIQPKAEAEIAFVLVADLPHPDTTAAEMMRAIDFAVAALEIVDSRVIDWNISLFDTVADNGSSGLYVLGSQPARLADVDLLSAGMVMECRGEPVSTGAGRACLGSPISAATWLARAMARVGRPLQAGDTILSGALGPMVTIEPGDVIEARISGLGSVTAAFEKGL